MLPGSSKSALGSTVEGAVPSIPGGTEPECFNHSKARVKAGSRQVPAARLFTLLCFPAGDGALWLEGISSRATGERQSGVCVCYQLRPKAAEMPVGAKVGPQAGPGHMGDLGMLGGSHGEIEGGKLHGDIFYCK